MRRNVFVLATAGEVAPVIRHVKDLTANMKLRLKRDASDQLVRDQQALIERLRQTEGFLRRGQDRHAFLLRLSDAMRPLHHPSDVQAHSCRLLAEYLHADRVFFAEISQDEDVGRVGPEWHCESLPDIVGSYRLSDFIETPEILGEGRPRCIDDTASTDASLVPEKGHQAYAALGIRAIATVPLVRGGKPVVMLSATYVAPHAWTEDELTLIYAVAERAWDGIERTSAEVALRESQDRLQLADRRKDEFLATLAHELRNPLAPLRNGLQVLRFGSRPGTPFERTLEMMDRQLGHLVRLVDDLLDVGRIASGKIQLDCDRVTLSNVLAQSVEASRAAIESHGHELIVEPVGEEIAVWADADRLTQVFSNLLSNAAKYTEGAGRIWVRVRREEGQAVIDVVDTGIGIPQADLSQVFDLFSQVRAHQGRTEGGLGIGLSLVRRLVEMHGGSVSAASAGAGQGSTFTVRLPLLHERNHDVPSLQDSTFVPAPPKRVLVVDDNTDAAASLTLVLEHMGHVAVAAHDGQDAVEKAGSFRPDLVFLDLGMPRMDGFDVARCLRAMPGGENIRLLALTGWGQEQDRQRTRQAGFDDHLLKPVSRERLHEILGDAFQPHAKQ